MQEPTLLDLLADITRLYAVYAERRLAPWGIHSGQGSILMALDLLGPCSQKELADFRQVSPATISVMLDRMESKNLIARIPSEEGGKRNQISLTPQGRDICAQLSGHMDESGEQVFAGLSAADREAARRIFRTVAANLSNT